MTALPTNVRDLGITRYEPVFAEMQTYTRARDDSSADEVWLTQHHPVFTQGQAGKPEHIFDAGEIPIVQSDRGGQVTYHGPGQITAYLLFDLRRLGIGVRDLVCGMEKAMLHTLGVFGVEVTPAKMLLVFMLTATKLDLWACGCGAAAVTTV